MTSPTTVSKFETLMASLDSLSNTLMAEQMFEESDLVDEALLFLNLLRGTDLLTPDPVEEEGPVTGDMATLRELCVQMKDLQNQALEIKAQSAFVKAPLDELRLKKIPELMESLGVKTATFAGLGRVQTAADLYASTRKGEKPNAMQWLRDCGYEGMIIETYNASSLKALFRRMLVDGAEIPDEIFNVQPFVRASIVKA
jgi:hypothetical protein